MYQPIISPYFKRRLKRYDKKYRHLKDAVSNTLDDFNKKTYKSLGANLYKVEIRVKDIPKGKRKSFRLIVLVVELEKYVVPITLYFKSDKKDINRKELKDHLKVILLELRLL